MRKDTSNNLETAVLGGGCFWCLETVFLHTKGIKSVISGYAGGEKNNPTYEEVSSGQTGHAEVVKLTFDPTIISYLDILHIFFSLHDPTTINRQGNDIGPQYRSIIFYQDEAQKKIARKIIKELTEENIYRHPVVTEVKSLNNFYPAENYHQNYFENNLEKPYCQIIVAPKLAKFRQKYSHFYK